MSDNYVHGESFLTGHLSFHANGRTQMVAKDTRKFNKPTEMSFNQKGYECLTLNGLVGKTCSLMVGNKGTVYPSGKAQAESQNNL